MAVLALFDVDGTLTEPRRPAAERMREYLQALRRGGVRVGILGGSDLDKIAEQLADGDVGALVRSYDYVFAENGLVAYAAGELVGKQDLGAFLGEARLREYVGECERYVAALVEGPGGDLPIKAGRHVEVRNGMINVSPVGRACTQAQRDAFEAWDAQHGVRQRFIDALRSRYPDWGLAYSVGGQISFDVVPAGWDKRYALRFVESADPPFDTVHFYGDKVLPGGNDHEIFEDPRTVGHAVTGPDDTMRQCAAQLGVGMVVDSEQVVQ